MAENPWLIHLTLPLPPSINTLYDGGKNTKQRFKSDPYQKWLEEARQFTRAFRADYEDANGGWWEVWCQPVAMLYRFGEIADKRARDVANYEKATSDLLVAENFLKDDSLIKRIGMEWADDVQAHYMEVVMVPLARMQFAIGGL